MNKWILTASGRTFDFIDPQPDMICIEDIAHALSNVCRFSGHTKRHWSVAHHSLLCTGIMAVTHPDADIIVAKQMLMHDATEAYIGDMATPLKSLCPDYRAIEHNIWCAIADKFDMPILMDKRVKEVDMIALVTERRDMMRKSDLSWGEHIEAIKPFTHSHINCDRLVQSNARTAFIATARDLGIKA